MADETTAETDIGVTEGGQGSEKKPNENIDVEGNEDKPDENVRDEAKVSPEDGGGEGDIPDEVAKPGEELESEQLEGEHVEVEQVESQDVEAEHVEGENVEGEHVEGEHSEGEQIEGEHVEDEHVEGEHVVGEHEEGKEKVANEETMGEEMMGEELEEEHLEEEQSKVERPVEDEEVEEEQYIEEGPPDPAAPYDFTDSKEALRPPFELSPEQMVEVEQLWDLYQDYTPAYTDIDNYITEKELVYMLNCLFIMTYTPEQLQELIAFCVRPPHPDGHITFEQFVKIVTMRQRDFPIEEELRAALQVYDPNKTGLIDREYFKQVLAKRGNKMPAKLLDNLIKEVDMSNDGTLGIEDIVGTMCIDLNKEDLIMLMNSLNPDQHQEAEPDEP